VGAYWLDATVTETGLVYYPPFCDPWYWWWCYPGGVGTGSIIRGSESSTEVGWNAGLGYDFAAGDGKVFIEAKYHYIMTDSEDFYYLPVMIGFRW
jgi:opacity protein-like surface antigen